MKKWHLKIAEHEEGTHWGSFSNGEATSGRQEENWTAFHSVTADDKVPTYSQHPTVQHNDNIFVLTAKGLNLQGSNKISHNNMSYMLSYAKLKALNEQYRDTSEH